MRGELVRAAGLHDAAGLEHDELVAERHRLDGVVGDDEAGALVGGEVPGEASPQLGPGAGVHGGERLVEQEQARFRGQGPRQGHALGLAAGERLGLRRGAVGQADPVQHGERALARRGAAGPARAQAEGDVLEHRHVGEQQVVLEHHPHRTLLGRHAHARGGVLEHVPVERHPAALERHETGEARSRVVLPAALGPSSTTTEPVPRAQRDVQLEGALGQGDAACEAHAGLRRCVAVQPVTATGTSGRAGRPGRRDRRSA